MVGDIAFVDAAWLLGRATRELTLFAAVGFTIGGIDDLFLDLVWLGRTAWRRLTIFRHFPRTTMVTLPPPDNSGRIAVMIAAWDESAVIEQMLNAALARFIHADFTIYVGTYPNDPATVAAVDRMARNDARVRLVPGLRDGPTSKAECLNRVWRQIVADEKAAGPVKAVVIHDAEDVVHPLELRLFDTLIERFDMIQLPVIPLRHPNSPWVSAVYCDEFAEAHGKDLIVREALGAGVPSAGVGCAISRAAMGRLTEAGAGRPFDEDSVTEDYELGLRLAASGGRAAFVSMPAAPGKPPVAVQAYFPGSFATSVRQKTRWVRGIALSGWDRLGWQGGWAERWMRLRDRRAIIAALVLTVGYAALALGALCLILGIPIQTTPLADILLPVTGGFLLWRVAMRCWMVTRVNGWRQGLLAIPRMIVGNIIAIAAARQALFGYVRPSGRAGKRPRTNFRHSCRAISHAPPAAARGDRDPARLDRPARLGALAGA